ncbi:hypothetical protein [Trinickia mobilis]|uniref:hypothetical protein n=1 Tax=Trinickia mobilis TaxID=2816356 RepID=UPI001A8CE4DB|nr:hypothetical protein [Trinickia mobilis]
MQLHAREHLVERHAFSDARFCLFQDRDNLLDTEAFAFHRTAPFPSKSLPKTRLHHGTVYRGPLTARDSRVQVGMELDPNKKAAESTGRPKHDRMREDRACAL